MKLFDRGRLGPRIAALVVLSIPGLASARQFLPPENWMAPLRPDAPFISYKLGIIDFEEGTGGDWAEYSGDLRVALRDSNFFDKNAARRLRVRVSRGFADVVVDNERAVTTGKLVITYRFLDGEQVVHEQQVVTQSLTDMYANSSDPRAAMAANLQLLLVNLRKAGGDAAFIAQAERLEQDIHRDLADKGVGFSGLMTRGFIAGAEGAVAVVRGVGAVAGTALEVAASPEFQTAMNDAMAEQARQQAQQQAQQQAMLDQIRRDAEEAQRQKDLEEQRLAAERAEQARQKQLAQLAQVEAVLARNAQQQQQQTQQQMEQQRIAEQRRQEEQRRLAEQQRLDAQRKQEEQRRLAEQQRLEAQRKAEEERIAAQRRQEEERRAAEARRGLNTPVRLASAPPVGTLTREWSGWFLYGSHNNVDVYWRARLYDDGIRVQWRCANGTSDKRYCSIGGENNGNKIYYCYRGNAQVGRGGAMGEASDVRPGGDYQFVGETSCSRMDATFVLPQVRISAVIPVW